MTRIDHAGKARQILAEIPDGATEAGTMAWCAEAQVHAQLAIVEQQRIGNLIAVMANALAGVGAGEHSTAEYVRLHQRINPQILAALGLTAEQEGETE